MDVLLLCLSVITLAKGFATLKALRRIPLLAEIPLASLADEDLPSVTIACAGRGEAAHWERAVRSWLRQDLPRLEVIVVDDRSDDGSFEILERLAAEDPRVVALRVDERPAGWLGKCNALSVAAARASGDYILFTDADVRLEDGALRRAVTYAARESADHLTLTPELETDDELQRAFTIAFFHEFLLAARADHANSDDGACFIGVGAFNMVRRSVYEAAGGHEPIRMQVGDDVALARLLQLAGGRHRVLSGLGLVRLSWHQGVVGTIRGLEKNAFWGARLSVPVVLLLTLLGGLSLLPALGLFGFGALGSAAFILWIAGIALPHVAPGVPGGGPGGRSWLSIPARPLSTILLTVTLWNSMLVALDRGGITWRGDFFPLADLRAALKPLRWWTG